MKRSSRSDVDNTGISMTLAGPVNAGVAIGSSSLIMKGVGANAALGSAVPYVSVGSGILFGFANVALTYLFLKLYTKRKLSQVAYEMQFKGEMPSDDDIKGAAVRSFIVSPVKSITIVENHRRVEEIVAYRIIYKISDDHSVEWDVPATLSKVNGADTTQVENPVFIDISKVKVASITINNNDPLMQCILASESPMRLYYQSKTAKRVLVGQVSGAVLAVAICLGLGLAGINVGSLVFGAVLSGAMFAGGIVAGASFDMFEPGKSVKSAAKSVSGFFSRCLPSKAELPEEANKLLSGNNPRS